MELPNELFFGLSNTAWTAISSIATSLALITALTIPSIEKLGKRFKIYYLIENEIKKNIKIIEKAYNEENVTFTIKNASRSIIKGFLLIDINMEYWNDNKQYVSECSKKRYEKYYKMNKELNDIKELSSDIIHYDSVTAPLEYIEIALEKIYMKITEYKRCLNIKK